MLNHLSMDDPVDITRLLDELRSGDTGAWGEILRGLYQDLRRIARGTRSVDDPLLDTTGLVHEAWIRLAERGDTPIRNRAHFFALAARIMRHVVCDYARERLAEKRGAGAAHVSLSAAEQIEHEDARSFADIDAALKTLALTAPRQVQVVECRFFLGLSDEETAEALHSSVRTVRRDWANAREWLRRTMTRDAIGN